MLASGKGQDGKRESTLKLHDDYCWTMSNVTTAVGIRILKLKNCEKLNYQMNLRAFQAIN